MARPLRIEFAGALYHVTSRGDRREASYENDEDREAVLGGFAGAAALEQLSGGGRSLLSQFGSAQAQTRQRYRRCGKV